MIPDLVTQSRKEVHASIDKDRHLAAIVSKLYRRLCHAYVFLQPSCPSSSRRRCTPTTSRRYHALAIASFAGEVPSAAAATAAATPDSSSVLPSSARSAALARMAVGAIAPYAMRAPETRPPTLGTCAAMEIT